MKNLYAAVLAGTALLLSGTLEAQSGSNPNARVAGQHADLANAILQPHHASLNEARGGGAAPANDDCTGADNQDLAIGSTLTFSGDNTGATVDAPTEFVLVWHAFTTTECANVTINYCVAGSQFTGFFVNLAVQCPDFLTGILNGAADSCTLSFYGLPAGTYYIPVRVDPTLTPVGPYTIEVSAAACAATPPNDGCGAIPVDLAVGSSINFTGTTAGATNTGDFVPGSALDGQAPTVWHAFTTTACANVTVSCCGTTPAFGNVWIFLAPSCPAGDDYILAPYDFTTCSDGNATMVYAYLPAGTYYLPVQFDATGANGPYTIEVSATECIAPTAYCIPNPATGTTDGDFIATVQLGDINYTGPNDVNYVDNTAMSTNLSRNATYTITITGGTYAPDVYAAWIDYNHDFMFAQASEKLGEVATLSEAGEVVSITFTVPLTADLGPARLRVRGAYNSAGNINACDDYTYGETEDYTVNIQMEVGVQELNSSNLSVYPNPSNGNITIAGADLNGPVNFELTDMTGRVVYKEQRTMTAGQPVILALSGKLAQGTYSLRMITANGISSRAVMIQ